MSHEKLKELNDWCSSTDVLHLWVNFQNRTGDWAVRVLTNAWGKSHPLRTCTGTDLESVCEEMLPKAQKSYEERKASILRDDKKFGHRMAAAARADAREIEAMHHTADDF